MAEIPAQVSPQRVSDRIQVAYEPRGGCRDLFHLRDPEVLLSGPAGTGKSMACLYKVLTALIKYPGARALIVRKTRTTLTSTVLVTFREKVARELIRAKQLRFYGGSQEEPAQYVFRNGSTIVLAGMDQATKVMSSEYDLIYVNEAVELTQHDWEALSTRLRHGRMPYQQLLADTNPAHPTHWLKQRCDRRTTRLVETRHRDNPAYFTPDGELTEQGRAYMARLDDLTGVEKLRLKDGKWVAAEGVIYGEFDASIHVVDGMPEGWESWTRWWSVDFGYTHAFVIQMWAEDGDGRLWLYRELFRVGRTAEQMATAALDLVAPEVDGQRVWLEPKPRDIITDHNPEYRTQFEKTLGRSTTKAQKEVIAGIQAVQKRLQENRLFLLRDALTNRDQELDEKALPCSTIEEISGYVWADSKTKEQPVKENDHGCDALRYLVAERDFGGRPGMRFMSI